MNCFLLVIHSGYEVSIAEKIQDKPASYMGIHCLSNRIRNYVNINFVSFSFF